MTLLSLRDVRFRYGPSAEALRGITLDVASPQVISIAGPNGSGKSTLLDVVAGLKRPSDGTCEVKGRPAASYKRAEFCRFTAHVPQQVPQGIPYTVEQVALTGRTPHGLGLFDTVEDVRAADEALRRTGTDFLRRRRFSTLSGGEQQRVLLAAAICQRPEILLLDEPGAHLDPKNEAWLWTLLRELRDEGCLVIVVTHHLSLAARHSDRVWLLRCGELAADSAPAEAFDPARLSEVYEVPFHRLEDRVGRVYLSYGE